MYFKYVFETLVFQIHVVYNTAVTEQAVASFSHYTFHGRLASLSHQANSCPMHCRFFTSKRWPVSHTTHFMAV